MLRKWSVCVVLAGLVALTAAGCSSDSSGGITGGAGGDVAAPEQFYDTLTGEQPAVRRYDLSAGTALRAFVKPDGDLAGDGFAIGIAIDDATFSTWDAAGVFVQESDEDLNPAEVTERFYSDYDTVGSTADFGHVIQRTAFVSPGSGGVSTDPVPRFFVAGRGWGSAAEHGTWITYIAPADGTYFLLIDGLGDFEVSVDQRPLPDDAAPDAADSGSFDQGPAGLSDVFPYTGDAWVAVAGEQIDFLFDDSFFPVDEFFSDYEDGPEPYGPTSEVKVEVEGSLGL